MTNPVTPKSTSLHIKVSPADKKAIVARAKAAHRTLSDYGRVMMLHGEMQSGVTKVVHSLSPTEEEKLYGRSPR